MLTEELPHRKYVSLINYARIRVVDFTFPFLLAAGVVGAGPVPARVAGVASVPYRGDRG